MRSAPFFSTSKGKVCGAGVVVASLLAGVMAYRFFCGGVVRDAIPQSVGHEEMHRSLEEQTRRLEVLQQDVDAANLNLEEISDILKGETSTTEVSATEVSATEVSATPTEESP